MEFVNQLIAYTRAQAHASDTFRVTIDQLLKGLPQGSDLENVVQALQLTIVAFLPEGPTPPWPSRSSSSSNIQLNLGADASSVIAALQRAAERKA